MSSGDAISASREQNVIGPTARAIAVEVESVVVAVVVAAVTAVVEVAMVVVAVVPGG